MQMFGGGDGWAYDTVLAVQHGFEFDGKRQILVGWRFGLQYKATPLGGSVW